MEGSHAKMILVVTNNIVVVVVVLVGVPSDYYPELLLAMLCCDRFSLGTGWGF